MEDGHSLGWRAARCIYYVYLNSNLTQRYVTTTRNAEYMIDEIKSRYEGLALESLTIRKSSSEDEPSVLIYTLKDEKYWKNISNT
jgi:hypothetical protein